VTGIDKAFDRAERTFVSTVCDVVDSANLRGGQVFVDMAVSAGRVGQDESAGDSTEPARTGVGGKTSVMFRAWLLLAGFEVIARGRSGRPRDRCVQNDRSNEECRVPEIPSGFHALQNPGCYTSHETITDDPLRLCGNPKRWPISWTETRNISCSASFEPGLKAIQPWKEGLSGNWDRAAIAAGSKSPGVPSTS
jgi:hypothetical protein